MNKQNKIIFMGILLSLAVITSLNWSEDLANMEKAWEEFLPALPLTFPHLKLTESVNTESLFAKQKDNLLKLTQEPFLRVIGFDYTAAIEERIVLAKKNILTLKDELETVKNAQAKFKEANFEETFNNLTGLEGNLRETIKLNLKLYNQLFQLYSKVEEPDGYLEEMDQEIENLKQRVTNQLKTEQEMKKEYQELVAPLFKELEEKKLNNASLTLEELTKTSEIKEFLQIITAWFNNPEQSISTTHLNLITEQLITLFDDDSPLSANSTIEKIYLTEQMLEKNVRERIDTAIESRNKFLEDYKNYRNFFLSEHWYFILDESVKANELLSLYQIENKPAAKGWQPEGTWNYPTIYQIKGIKDKLFTIEPNVSLEVVNIEESLISRLPDLQILSSKNNQTFLISLNQLQKLIPEISSLREEINNLVNLLKENDEKEKAALQEKIAAIDKLAEEALNRYKKIRQEIQDGVYLKISLNEFKEKLNLEQRQITQYAKEVFLIHTEGLSNKAKEATEKLENASQELIKEFLARCACEFEGEYNQELAEGIKALQQRIEAFSKIEDVPKLSKEYMSMQSEFHNLKKGNVKHTEIGETLTLQRTAENEKALSRLEEDWAKVRFLYYQKTTAPTLSAVKIAGQEVKEEVVILPLGKTEIEVNGQTILNYGAVQSGFTVQKVEYSIDEGKTFQLALGKEKWSFSLTFAPEEKKTLLIRAFDSAGTISPLIEVILNAPEIPEEDNEAKLKEKPSSTRRRNPKK